MPWEYSACLLCAGCCSAACLLVVYARVVRWSLTLCLARLADCRLSGVRFAPRELRSGDALGVLSMLALRWLLFSRLFACCVCSCRSLVAHVVSCSSC